MCLMIASEKQVAKRDFFVYKVIGIDNNSEIQNFQYTENTRYKLDQPLLPFLGEIDEGFHAYFIPNEAVLRSVTRWIFFEGNCVSNGFGMKAHGLKFVQFIVPKGAEYFLGTEDDIVSDTIISGDLKAMPNPFREA